MAAVRTRDTAPEMRVRRALHAAGLRYRLHDRRLPGSPDLVFARYRAVVFVHGCFWHQHPGCPKSALPATNHEFWAHKLRGNAERDRRQVAALEQAGWRVHVVWECESRDLGRLALLADALHRREPDGTANPRKAGA